jgi:hypothetical protein
MTTMAGASLPVMAAWANAALFLLAGVINLTAVRPVREVYERWDIPAGFYRSLGIVEIAAAAFLVSPEYRAWGIALALPIMFGSIVMLLDHRHYLIAVPALVIMAALAPAALSVPPPAYSFIGQAPETPETAVVAITPGLATESYVTPVREP